MPTSTKCQKIEKKMTINVNENEKPTNPQFQKNWDNINIKRIIANDLIFNSPRDLARFKALQCRESGSWLHAIPSPNIGTMAAKKFWPSLS
jgi:hypothetical protein